MDARKYLRFQSWVLEKEGQLVPFEVPNNMMTGSQMREEGAEFEKLYRLNKLAREKGVADNASASSEYQKGVYTSEMKQKATGDGSELERRIEELQRSLNRREEREWQPAHLLLTRCGLQDPHADKKVKPPMYFKGHEVRKGYTEFEKRETLNQMPVSSMA